jgi:hypothetical protein
MRMRTLALMLCAALTIAGCAPPEKVKPSAKAESDLIDYTRDAIPTGVPLPKSGVNQRPVLGPKTVLLSVINWKGENTLDKRVFEQLVLGGGESLKTYVDVASVGKLTLTGQAIAHTSSDPRPDICKSGSPFPMALAIAEGDNAAKANGLDAANFDYMINVIDCGGGGQAYMPGRVINSYGDANVHLFIHEFAHNLGFDHSHTYSGCAKNGNTVTAPNGCTTTGYGDTGNPVGGGFSVLFPMHYRWYAGWLGKTRVQNVDRSGRYLIGRSSASVSPTTPPQLLLINRTTSPTQIALEYRGNMMFDSYPPGDNRITGVWVRFTTMAEIVATQQLDGTPGTETTSDPTLQPGQILRDEESGITVMVCGPSGDNAAVAISLKNEPMPHCNS